MQGFKSCIILIFSPLLIYGAASEGGNDASMVHAGAGVDLSRTASEEMLRGDYNRIRSQIEALRGGSGNASTYLRFRATFYEAALKHRDNSSREVSSSDILISETEMPIPHAVSTSDVATARVAGAALDVDVPAEPFPLLVPSTMDSEGVLGGISEALMAAAVIAAERPSVAAHLATGGGGAAGGASASSLVSVLVAALATGGGGATASGTTVAASPAPAPASATSNVGADTVNDERV